jgi:ABC-type nitrate/sulfonate/bicarbonate transport system permease component
MGISWLGLVQNSYADKELRAMRALFIYLRSMALLLVLWHLLSIQIHNPILLPSPLLVTENLGRLLLSGELLESMLVSLRRLVVSFGLAGLVGIPLGILMGLSRWAEHLLDPVVELLRPISGIAWIPLGLFIFGVGDQLPIFIMFYSAFFPFVLNTVVGVQATDPLLIRAARTMGVDQWVIIQHVVLPAALPSILVGTRLAAGASWTALVAAELIGAPSGLGFSIEWYRELLMTPKVMASIAIVGLLGYLTDCGLRMLQQRLTPWAISLGEVQ